jgi:hypothetical protein
MGRTIDQIRASKLPSNMMQFAARGALSVPPAESIEILVHLARHNKVFGDVARMTLAGWDEKASLAAASDPQTTREVLDYMISPDNMRPKLLPALLENPSVHEDALTKFAISAARESIEVMLQSPRIKASTRVLDTLRSNPYLRGNESEEIKKLLQIETAEVSDASTHSSAGDDAAVTSEKSTEKNSTEKNSTEKNSTEKNSTEKNSTDDTSTDDSSTEESSTEESGDVPDEAVSAYLAEHAGEIAEEEGKPFQPIGGIIELLGADYFPVSHVGDVPESAPASPAASASAGSTTAQAAAAPRAAAKKPVADPKRENTLQKINHLDVKGRIQLALKGSKEERSILIRDGTKVVALAVLEGPKLSDGEVEKFASQKNVLQAVLRQIPLKRRFMKNYIVVRNLVANPRTPLDLGLGLMKNLLAQDLKNLSANKDVSDTIRKLALKMFKQKMETANKK